VQRNKELSLHTTIQFYTQTQCCLVVILLYKLSYHRSQRIICTLYSCSDFLYILTPIPQLTLTDLTLSSHHRIVSYCVVVCSLSWVLVFTAVSSYQIHHFYAFTNRLVVAFCFVFYSYRFSIRFKVIFMCFWPGATFWLKVMGCISHSLSLFNVDKLDVGAKY